MATWATKEDLVLRYGQEYVEKLAIRRDWNEDAEAYVADESPERIDQVINAALQDAKDWLLWKISCCFNIVDFNALAEVSFVKRFHIKLTIIMLKDGGDCQECKECQDEFSDFCSCGSICDINGNCISKPTIGLIAVEKMPRSCLPQNYCCGCNSHRCCCA